MSDHITFSCATCGATVVHDQSKPLKDDDILSCQGCSREFGTVAQVRAAMVAQGKAEIDKLVMERFGKKPNWTKR